MAEKFEEVTLEFIAMLEQDDIGLGAEFDTAIIKAGFPVINNRDALYRYINANVLCLPRDAETLLSFIGLYWVAAHSELITTNQQYQKWLIRMVSTWGEFLDTPASAAALKQFIASLLALDENFDLTQYDPGPSGWLSFNQFFARSVKPGKRPIDAFDDPNIIVSAADGEFRGQFDISENSQISSKGIMLNLHELLEDSPYKNEFKGGVFTHTLLRLTDYHRFHTPVSGEVLEARNIDGLVTLGFERDDDGNIKLEMVLEEGFLFHQMRGLIVMKSPEVGLVAMLAIGIAQISSVKITPEVGSYLSKGQEFGYFQFGGSDVITLYQEGKIEFEEHAIAGKSYLQGQQVGHLKTQE